MGLAFSAKGTFYFFKIGLVHSGVRVHRAFFYLLLPIIGGDGQDAPPMAGGALSTKGVGFSCAKWASNQEAMEGIDMVINQMIGGHTD